MIRLTLRWIGRFLAKDSTFLDHLSRGLIEQPIRFGPSENLHISPKARLAANVVMNCHCGKILIDDYAFFGHNVLLLTGTHDIEKRGIERTTTSTVVDRDIVIGRGAWVSSGCIIIGPCSIGEDAVLAPGVVMTGEVERGVIVRCTQEHRVEKIRFK